MEDKEKELTGEETTKELTSGKGNDDE